MPQGNFSQDSMEEGRLLSLSMIKKLEDFFFHSPKKRRKRKKNKGKKNINF